MECQESAVLEAVTVKGFKRAKQGTMSGAAEMSHFEEIRACDPSNGFSGVVRAETGESCLKNQCGVKKWNRM